MSISRRDITMGLGAVAAVAAAGWGFFHGRAYPSTPYDDLLDQITDRRPAITLGKAMAKTNPSALADRLRRPDFGLRRRAREDAAAGRVSEVKGWIVPQTVALYAQMAANANS